MMERIAEILPCYHPAEDGDMISFGPHCTLSVDKVRGMVKDSGPLVKRELDRWIENLRVFCAPDAERGAT